MLEVKFYKINEIEDSLLKFAVIVSKYQDLWIFCKHKDRETFEIPGGHREKNETIHETARRELVEETGAINFELTPICIYAVKRDTESFGLLYFAQVEELGKLPESEMERIALFKEIPENQTYPLIQPQLFKKVVNTLKENV